MEITNPPRVAIGSHIDGNGYGCAMNVIAWETGEQAITDMPACANEMLAKLIHNMNDNMCHETTDIPAHTWVDAPPFDGVAGAFVARPIRVLCPSCSMAVLELAHRTVGTAGLMDTQATGILMLELMREATKVTHPWANAYLTKEIDACNRSAQQIKDWEKDRIAPPMNTRSAWSGWCDGIMDVLSEYLFQGLTREHSVAYVTRVFNRYEAVTGRVAPKPDPAVVEQALAWMEAGEREPA